MLPGCYSHGITGMERACSKNSYAGEKMEPGRRENGSCLGQDIVMVCDVETSLEEGTEVRGQHQCFKLEVAVRKSVSTGDFQKRCRGKGNLVHCRV